MSVLIDPEIRAHNYHLEPCLLASCISGLSSEFNLDSHTFRGMDPLEPKPKDLLASQFRISEKSGSNLNFNAPPDVSQPVSSLTRPRLVKMRKQTNTHNLKPSVASPDHEFGIGFTALRPVSENSVSISSGGSGVTASGGSGNETFVFGAKNDSVLDKDVVQDMKNLKIGNVSEDGLNSKVWCTGSEQLPFVFKSGGQTSSSSNETLLSKLSEDMLKCNIEGQCTGLAKGGGSSITCTDDESKFMSTSTDTIGGSIGKDVEAQLQEELKKKLNIEETDSNIMGKSDDCSKFTFQSRNAGVDTFTSSASGDLLNQMNDLNVNDSYVGSRKESTLLRKMEKLKVGSCEQASRSSSENEMINANLSNRPDGFDQHKEVSKMAGSADPSTSFPSSSDLNIFGVPYADAAVKKDGFIFTGKQDKNGPTHVEFKMQTTKADIFSGIEQKFEFSAKKEPRRNTMNKNSGKLNYATPVQQCHGQYFVPKESNSQENTEAFESYSPMDVSPYQEILADVECSRGNSMTSNESESPEVNITTVGGTPTISTDNADEDLIFATQSLDINCGDAIFSGTEHDSADFLTGKVDAEGNADESMAETETESFKSANEEIDVTSDCSVMLQGTDVSSSKNTEKHESDSRMHLGCASGSDGSSSLNFMFAASSAAQTQPLTSKRHGKKKKGVKSTDTYNNASNVKVPYSSSSLSYFTLPSTSTLLLHGQVFKDERSNSDMKVECSEVNNMQETKEESVSTCAEIVAAQEACEKWRLRGNNAYKNGDLSTAEEYYTLGLNAISQSDRSRSCLRAMMLCYSNRAATRMSLGRIRDALEDCIIAAGIDPSFLRVQLRAANCYLSLGEAGEAVRCFRRCLQSGSEVVDRKITVEASDGLQKAQKFSEWLCHSRECLQRRTLCDVGTALEKVNEALIICPYADILLEMKAEALFMLRRYEEVIQLCEESLGSAEKNFRPINSDKQPVELDSSEILKKFHFRFWRCHLALKSYFHLGKLDEGIASFEEQGKFFSALKGNGSKILESSIPLAITVRELIRFKAAGNQAFQAGKHAEAVEYYTAALSCNVESRPFAAVCFCNRAAAHKALGQITDAIADCSLAIALDGNYLKALSRRATLYEMIRDYGQAASDLQKLVSLLSKHVENKANEYGTSDRSNNLVSDLRQARIQLSEVEEESRKDIPLDLYLILGVEPSVSASEIKKAYRKAALRHHPDKAGQSLIRSENGDDRLWKELGEEVHKDADRLFKMIGEAYAVLSDTTKRARYDAEEEMRNAQKKRNGSSTVRTNTDTPYYPSERSSNRRHWRDAYQTYGNPYPRGTETARASKFSDK